MKTLDIRQVNLRLLPVKLHYFLLMTAIACVFPFQTIFAKQLGLSAGEVGVIFCAVPFFKLITNPIFGFILDKLKRIRLTISAAMLILVSSYLALTVIPPKSGHSSWDISENDLYTKLIYSCQNETHPHFCYPRLSIYNEYRIIDASARDKNSFDCDIQCSNSRNKITTNKSKDTILHCSPEMRFEFKVSVDVSICGIDIRSEKGDMVIVIGNGQIPVPVDVSNSSLRKVSSQSSSSENCSAEITSLSSLENEIHGKVSEDEQLSEGEDFFKGKKDNASITVPDSGNTDMKLYALHQMINLPTDGFIKDNSCSIEFDCQTKKCFSKPQFETPANEFSSLQFWSLLLLFAMCNATYSAVTFMTDTVCHELLKLQDKGDQFGQQRMFGTFGWGVGCLAAGYLNHIVSIDSEDVEYQYSFYLLAIIISVDIIPVYCIKVKHFQYSPDILQDVLFLFKKMDIIYNLVIVYFIGVLTGLIFNYEFWLMQEIGSSQVLLGLSQTFECIYELPCFMLSGWVIKNIGHDHCNSVVLLCFGLRCLCFVFMYNPWWSLAAALFHGPTFGLFVASMTTYAKNAAPPGTEATVQSLIQLAFEALGTGTGSILGGMGVDKFGCRKTFWYAAEFSFSVLFINILWWLFRWIRHHNSSSDSSFRHRKPYVLSEKHTVEDTKYSVIQQNLDSVKVTTSFLETGPID